MVTRISAANTSAAYGGTSKTSSSSGFSKVLDNTVQKQSKTENLDDIFNAAASKYNVPVKLLKAVAKAESGFQSDAVSSCGAEGVMQLMPSTAASLGVENAFDPEQNIMGGAKYLSGLLSSFGGDTKLAVAAYNAGSGNVKKYGGVPPFKETQNYVRKVLGYAGEDISAGCVSTGNSQSDGNSTAGTSGINTFPSILNLDNISLNEEDYLLLVKMFVQNLEQNALNSTSYSSNLYDSL